MSVASSHRVHRCQWLRLTGFTGVSGFGSPGSPVSVVSMTAWCPYLLVCRIRLRFRKAASEHLRKKVSQLVQKRNISMEQDRQDKIIFLKIVLEILDNIK